MKSAQSTNRLQKVSSSSPDCLRILFSMETVGYSCSKVTGNRFDEETKQSFMELYDKVDADVNFGDDEEPSNQELLDQINS